MPDLGPLPAYARTSVLALASVLTLGAIAFAAHFHHNFAVHMARHIVLMDIAAPLLVLGWPSMSFPRWARVLAAPGLAAVLHAVVMWGWHLPSAFAAAMGSHVLHAVMQASFLLAGIVFWFGVLPRSAARSGPAVFWLFMTVMHVGFLGALITFAPQPIYQGIGLADQQLAGLIMWIGAGAIYVLGGVVMAARWLTGIGHAAAEESLRWRTSTSLR